jgi:hypothetical protein
MNNLIKRYLEKVVKTRGSLLRLRYQVKNEEVIVLAHAVSGRNFFEAQRHLKRTIFVLFKNERKFVHAPLLCSAFGTFVIKKLKFVFG